MLISIYFVLLIPFIGQVHAGEDEDGAKEEVDGDLLTEDGPSEDDRGDGIEIDVVGGDDGGELFKYQVPHQVTAHRGHAT